MRPNPQISGEAMRFLPTYGKRANFSREAVERCSCGFGRVPERNVPIGNFANPL
jgi:hypothetical protein